MKSAKGGKGTEQQQPCFQDDNPTCEGGNPRIRRLPATGSYISPPERHTGSRASVDQHDAGNLDVKHGITQSQRWQIQKMFAVLPLWPKYCAEYLPEKAIAGGTLPSSCTIWDMWSEVVSMEEIHTQINRAHWHIFTASTIPCVSQEMRVSEMYAILSVCPPMWTMRGQRGAAIVTYQDYINVRASGCCRNSTAKTRKGKG